MDLTFVEIVSICGGVIVLSNVFKVFAWPIIQKFLKIEKNEKQILYNTKKVEGLPELIATQQRQIDEIHERLDRGTDKFKMIEKEVSEIKLEIASNNALLKSMDMKLEILVNAQMGFQQSKEDIEMLASIYKNKKLDKLKRGD